MRSKNIIHARSDLTQKCVLIDDPPLKSFIIVTDFNVRRKAALWIWNLYKENEPLFYGQLACEISNSQTKRGQLVSHNFQRGRYFLKGMTIKEMILLYCQHIKSYFYIAFYIPLLFSHFTVYVFYDIK